MSPFDVSVPLLFWHKWFPYQLKSGFGMLLRDMEAKLGLDITADNVKTEEEAFWIQFFHDFQLQFKIDSV